MNETLKSIDVFDIDEKSFLILLEALSKASQARKKYLPKLIDDCKEYFHTCEAILKKQEDLTVANEINVNFMGKFSKFSCSCPEINSKKLNNEISELKLLKAKFK